jgi:hypothetical protein
MRTLNLIFPSLGVCLLFTCLGEGGSCRSKEATVSKAPVESNNRLAKGVWGGQHIRLEVTGSGATLEFDCGNSTIAEPIVLDRNGNFDVRGKYTPEHGGPIRNDEESNSYSVRYVGHASNKELTLTITIPDKKETIGNFTLTQGSEGRLMKCR